MTQLEYEEFDLQLDKAGDGYSVRVVQSPIGTTGPEQFQLPGSPESLKLLVLTLRAVRGVRSLESDTAPDAKKYGGELFDAIFHDDILSALRGSLHVASSTNRGLRVRLRFSDPSVLANIPWELLYDTSRHRFLCQYGKYPVVRYIEIPEPVTPLKVEGPVRMLVVISAPRDYPEIDTEKEWERLTANLKPFVDSGRLRVDRLPTASLAAIHRALLEDEYHVFHYIGHGGVDPRSGDGVLALTGPDGLSRLESGTDVGVMLSNSPIRLAVLNSCEGGRISDVDPYAGTAISFVQQGIPAVVAMQFEISDEAAFAFSSTLYEAITEGRPIDLAVTLARQAILATSRSEWATPVLYLRASDGVIFDIASAPAQVADIPLTVLAEPTPSPMGATLTAEPPPTPPATPPSTQLPKAPAGPPVAPTGLTGTVVGRHDVDLRWEVPETGALAVSWEVMRDGAVTTASAVPGTTDLIPGPGTYTYTVVAIDEDGGRSPESETVTVVVGGPGSAPAPTTTERQPLAGSGAAAVREPGHVVAPPAPHLVGATVRRGVVQLAWTQDETPSAPVAYWLLSRDGQPIGRVEGEPRADDGHPGKGRHVYAVAAVGRGGGRSDPSDELAVKVGGGSPAWFALLLIPLAGLIWWLLPRDEAPTAGPAISTTPTQTTTQTGSTTGSPTSTTTVLPPADLSTTFSDPQDRAATVITLRVKNLSQALATDVTVTVRSDLGRTIRRATIPGDTCYPRDDVVACGVAKIRPGGVLTMTVYVDRLFGAFTLSAQTTTRTVDPVSSNNTDRLRLEAVTPPSSEAPTPPSSGESTPPSPSTSPPAG